MWRENGRKCPDRLWVRLPLSSVGTVPSTCCGCGSRVREREVRLMLEIEPREKTIMIGIGKTYSLFDHMSASAAAAVYEGEVAAVRHGYSGLPRTPVVKRIKVEDAGEGAESHSRN